MFRLLTVFFSVSLFMIIASCNKSSDNPVGLNPAVGSGSVVTNNGTFNFAYGLGRYNTTDNSTMIALTPQINIYSGNACLIYFNGKSTGNFNLNEDNAIVIIINNVTYYSKNSSGIISVSKYGAVGQQISGSFSGDFESVDGSVITVTSASFSVLRTNDVTDDDDDPFKDDELDKGSLYVEIEIKGEGVKTYSYTNMISSASLNEMADHFRIDFAISNQSDDEIYPELAVLSTLKTKTKTSGNTLKLSDDANNSDDSMIMVQIRDMVYYINGTAVITKFAQSTDEYFEVSAQGKLISLLDKSEAGNITNLKMKIYRAL